MFISQIFQIQKCELKITSSGPRKLHVCMDVITEIHDSKVVPFISIHFWDIYVSVFLTMTEIHEMMHMLKELQVNILKDRVTEMGMSSHAVDIKTTMLCWSKNEGCFWALGLCTRTVVSYSFSWWLLSIKILNKKSNNPIGYLSGFLHFSLSRI